jgi:hypothetical protein
MYVGAGIVKKKGLLPFHFDFPTFPVTDSMTNKAQPIHFT